MKKTFYCKDLGVTCDCHFSAETIEELLAKVAEHARNEHNMKEMTEAIRLKIIGKTRETG